MISVAYFSPFVPPEWIAAHQVHPVWLPGALGSVRSVASTRRGVCSCADMLIAGAWRLAGADAIVLTTICDQMRYTAAYLQERGEVPVFLLNVPSTWQSAAVRQLYREELCRLGRFLVALGGCAPSPEHLQLTIQRYENARAAARGSWPPMGDSRYAERLAALRNGETWSSPVSGAGRVDSGVRLALVGGPLLGDDFALLELVAAAGGHVVLDGSEWGERTLPAPPGREELARDPVGEFVRAYFDEIPDVFRRPNTRLYDWLGAQIAARKVRGILLWRRLFCDLWHAELDTMRRWSPVPVLDIDAAEGDEQIAARTRGRLEAFLEMLS